MAATRRHRPGPLLLAGLLALVLLVGASGWFVFSDGGGSDADSEGTAGASMRIMLAGDSMTHGADGDQTWRYHLWHHLEPHVQDLDFVGPYSDPATQGQVMPSPGQEPAEPPSEGLSLTPETEPADDADYLDPDFDQDHNALWGRTLQDAAATIEEDVRAYEPDVLCVMLGLNDMVRPVGADDLERWLHRYVEGARAGNPDVRIVLAEALPISLADNDDDFALRVYGYNEIVRTAAVGLSTEASPVTSVDVASQEGWEVPADTYDGTHPNADGELKIAAAFADALSRGHGIGPGYPRPLPIAP